MRSGRGGGGGGRGVCSGKGQSDPRFPPSVPTELAALPFSIGSGLRPIGDLDPLRQYGRVPSALSPPPASAFSQRPPVGRAPYNPPNAGSGLSYYRRRPAKRKRALLGSNPPRNSRLETHSDGPGADRNWPAPGTRRLPCHRHHIAGARPLSILTRFGRVNWCGGRLR